MTPPTAAAGRLYRGALESRLLARGVAGAVGADVGVADLLAARASAPDFLSQLLRGPPSQGCALFGLNVSLADAAVAPKSRARYYPGNKDADEVVAASF
jgi:hypothetical protein